MKFKEKQISHKLVYECFFMKLYDDEFLELHVFKPAEVKALIKAKKIKEAKTLVALQHYFLEINYV